MASSIGEQYSRLSSVNAIQKLGFLINDPQESAQLKSQQNNLNPHLSHFGNAPSSANSTQIDLKNQIKNLLEVIGEGPIDTVPQNPVRNPRNADRSSSPNLTSTQQDHTPQAKTNKIQHTRSPSTDNSAIKRHIEYIHSLSAATVKQNGSPVKKEETFESSRSWYGQRAIRKDNGLNKSTDLAVYVDRGRVSAEKQPMTRWQKYEEQTREPLFNIKSNNFLTPIFNTNHRSQSNLHTQDALYNISREPGSIQAFYKASEEPQGNVEVNKTEKKKQRDITPTFRGNRSFSPMNGTHKEESLVFSLLNHTRPESKATSELGMMKEEKNKYLIEGDVYYVSTNKVMSHSPMRSQRLAYNFNEKESEDKKSNKLTAQQNKISPVKNPTVEKSETASPNKTSPNKVSLNQQQENEKMEMIKYYKELQRKTASEESAPAKTDRSINNQPPRPISKLGDKYYEEVPATQQRNQSSSSISYPKSNYDFGDPNANRQLPVEPRGNSLVQNGASKTGSQSGIKLSSAMTSPERDDAKLNSNLNKGRQRDVSNGTRIPSNQFSYDRVEESEQNYSNGGATKNDYSYSVSKSPQKNGAVNDKKAESVEKGNREMKNKTFNDTFGKEHSSASKKVEFVSLQQNSSPAKQLGQPQTRAEANVNPRNTQLVPTLDGQKMASEKELREKQEAKEEERKKAQQRNEMLRTVESMLKEEKKSSKDTKPEKKPETKAEPQKAAAKTEIPDITSIYGAPEKKKVVAKTQPNNVTNNPTATHKTDTPQKTNDPKQPADNKPTNVPADTKQNGGQAASKDATSQQKAQTATGTTSKTTAAAQDGKAAETQKKSDLNKVEIDKETLAKLEAALAKSNDPKIQMLMELIKKDPEKFNKVLDYVEHPEKMKAESQTDTKKDPGNKRASILENKRGSILENKRASILAPKRQSILITKQETTTQKKAEESVLSKVDEGEEKAWKEKEAADKAEIENLKQYLTYYQQYEGLYQQQQQMLYEKQMMIENLQKQPSSMGTSTNVSSSLGQTGGGSTQLIAPNLLGTQSGSTLQAPNLLGGGSTNTLPPPNLLGGGGGSTNTLPPPNLLGGGGSTNTLPPPNLLGGSGSNTLPPPNLLGEGSANTLPPPNLLGGGGSNTLPPPNLLGGSGSNTLPPPNLLGGGSTNMLPPPNLLGGGGSNTLPPPNLLGGGSGGLAPPNLLGNKGSGGLPPPNLLGAGSGGLPPPNLLGGGSGGLPPPNLLGGGSGGLPPPNLLGGGSGGLPPPNLLGKPGGLPPPNLLGGGPGGLPPPNLLGKPGGLPPPNLLGGGPGGLPPPNLLGKPGGMPPPNLLGGGPGGLQPPNLGLKPPTLGGPPNLLGGPPNLLGGSGGLGGPPKLNLGGPPNLSLNKGPTLGGPPNLNLSTNSQPKKNYKPIFWEAVPPQKFNDTIWAS